MNLEAIIATIENPSGRMFGIEIECINITPAQANAALNAAGVACYNENYNHQRRNHWKVVTDGSLTGSGAGRAAEVVSPPLPFNVESLNQVSVVMNALKAAGARVDHSCGMHVHVDSRDMASDMPDFSRILFLKYRECEEMIDRLVASSRRSNSGSYCRSMKNLQRTSNWTNLRYERYQKLNFQSFERHGTVEFRQHEGCLTDTKAVAWIIFCVTFYEQCRTYFREHRLTEVMTVAQWA